MMVPILLLYLHIKKFFMVIDFAQKQLFDLGDLWRLNPSH